MILFHARHAVALCFETSCVPARGRKLKIWQNNHAVCVTDEVP